MNVQRIEGVADLMGHARGQQRQRLGALALDRREGLLARLGGVVKNQGQAGAAALLAV